jgi:geranylgeranyl diphosphate synthase, type I
MGIFTVDREGHEAAALLARARRQVDPVLRAAVATLPRSMRRIAGYHFGWLHADGSPAAADAGKAIRPALVLAATQALGGPAESAVRAAAAAELVHNFTLLHDDVIDRDPTRRHRPTVWTVFGTADAILAGDAMQALALRILAEDPHPAAARAAARLSACVIELCDGQHADCSFERRADVSLNECLAMAEAKTGALLGSACAMGALYAEADEEAVEAMDAFGRQMGLAFQLIDDLIGIWGDPDVTGKPVGADLAARKKSLPVVAALRSGTPAGSRLAGIYAGDQPLSEAELREAAEAIDRAGGRDWAQMQACDRMAVAMSQLSQAIPDGTRTGELLALAELVTRRSH